MLFVVRAMEEVARVGGRGGWGGAGRAFVRWVHDAGAKAADSSHRVPPESSPSRVVCAPASHRLKQAKGMRADPDANDHTQRSRVQRARDGEDPCPTSTRPPIFKTYRQERRRLPALGSHAILDPAVPSETAQQHGGEPASCSARHDGRCSSSLALSLSRSFRAKKGGALGCWWRPFSI